MVELIRRVRHSPDSPSVTIGLKNGNRLSESIQTPSDLKGWEQTTGKFNDSIRGLLSEEQALAIIETVKRLQETPSIRTLTRALGRPATA